MQDKPGRRIRLQTLVDFERSRVQIIRNLSNTKGFLVDSGNMGWMPMEEWIAFLEKELKRANGQGKTLVEQFGFVLPEREAGA